MLISRGYKMKKTLVVVLALVVLSTVMIGCAQKDTYSGYASYGQQQPQGQQYVGGGCGVAQQQPYENTPIVNSQQAL